MTNNYVPLNYHEQGGSRTVIGGSIDIVNGGEVDFESGSYLKVGGVDFTARAKIMNFQSIIINVEDLSAGGDIASRAILKPIANRKFTLEGAQLIGHGSASGIDDSNTCVIVLSNDADAIVTATFDSDNAFPDAETPTDLGALHATRKVITSADVLTLSVTNGTTANPPIFDIVLFGYWEYNAT